MKHLRYALPALLLMAALGFAADAQATIGWAGNVWPLHGSNQVPTGPVTVYAQVWKGGTTDLPGQGAGISAELRYTTNLAPMQTVAMVYQGDVGSNDEYKGDIPQAALVGASWVDVTVIFTDLTDNTTFEVTGDQAGHAPPLRYNIVNVLPNDVVVRFTLCMSGAPTAGAPCVIGSAPPLGVWGTGVTMTLLSGELYAVDVTFPAGSNPSFEYKYKKDACATWENGGNRSVTLPTDGTASVILPPDSYDYAPLGCGLGQVLNHDKVVCFQVCMLGVEAPPVCVIGSGDLLTNWTTGVPMTMVGPNLYQACITYPAGLPIPQNVEYKYKKDGCATWESVGNRILVIDNSSPNEQTLFNAWDNGVNACAPVGAKRSTWGNLKALYR